MKLKSNALQVSTLTMVCALIVLIGCKDEVPERLTLQETADLTEEALTDAYFQDIDDMAGIAIGSPSDAQYSSGRTSGSVDIDDQRFQCAGLTVTLDVGADSTPENPRGTLTVDFGDSGCTDPRGNIRTGKLIFTYSGKRFMPGSTVVTTIEGYTINGIKLEGTRMLTNAQTSTADAPRFNVVLTHGKATFPNESVVTREANITWQWNRAANPLEDNLEIDVTSTASGTTRGGRTYEVAVLEPLVYKRHCGIAVSGIKKYTIDGEKQITIDFGDGTCDRAFAVTVNGVTHQVGL